MIGKAFKKFTIEPLIPVFLYRLFIVYLLFTLCRIEFYLFNAAFYKGISFPHFLYLLWGGIKFDTVAILYTNIVFIVLHTIPFKFRYKRFYQQILFYLFVFTNSIALLSNFIDYMYYRYTLRRTTFSVFREFMNETNMGRLSVRFLYDYWYAVILFAATIYFMIWLYKKVKVQKEFNGPIWWSYYTKALIFFVITIILFIGGVRGDFKHSTRPITLSNAGDYASNPAEMHIVLNTPFSIYKTLEIKSLEKQNFFSEKELAQIYNPVHIPNPHGSFKKMNVIFIVLESFGRENVGFFNKDLDNGNYQGYTPFIDSLCQNSLIFWDSYANGRKSIDALPSVISSIPSIVEPFVLTEYYDNNLPSIAKLLKAEGYHTSFFHGAPNGSMGFNALMRMAGVDHYYGMNEYKNPADFDGMWGVWDEPFLQFMSNTIDTFPEPFFSCVFTVSSHHPFELPAKYKGKFKEGTHPIHKTIRYTDNALREFFNTAKKQKWFKNTLFVLTADHCNTTPTHDVYLNSSGYFSIPVIFYSGSDTLRGLRHELVQQIDIMPTVLGLLNYNKPYFAFGFDALNDTNRFVVNYMSDSYQIFKGNYLLQFHNGKSVSLYNYKEDRLLQNNLVESLKDTVKQMEILAKAFSQQYCNRMIENRLQP